MAYLKINGIDFSHCVNELNVSRTANYSAQTNAAGNTVVDYINHKRTVEVGFIPLDNQSMVALQTAIEGLSISLTFRNPLTGVLVENITCILPENNVEFYTIQANKVLFKAFKLKFIEL